jgi:hypothetical protein
MPSSLQGGCGRAEGRPGKSANRSRSTLNNELIFLLGLALDRLDGSGSRSLSNLGAHQVHHRAAILLKKFGGLKSIHQAVI